VWKGAAIISVMSELNFFESTDIPQPRDKIKIESVEANPYPDGWRVKLVIRVTPFQERPNLEITIDNIDGRRVAELTVIETMHRHMEFTIHIRGVPTPVGSYIVKTELYYEDRAKAQSFHETPFSVEAA
jgi:hypothetical protein